MVVIFGFLASKNIEKNILFFQKTKFWQKMAQIGFFYTKNCQFKFFTANWAKTKININKMLCTFIYNTLKIVYVKYEHISLSSYRVLIWYHLEYWLFR